MRITDQPRPCERRCVECKEYKHYSRFRSWKTRSGKFHRGERHRTVSFASECRDCELKARNEEKNADRPKAIIDGRAKTAAGKAGVKSEFFWMQMNYRALVPMFRAMMTPEGLCLNCGHAFLNERDIQIEHIDPPRSSQDWALLHARNLRLFCASCNGKKGDKPHSQWCDEQEEARLSNANAARPTNETPVDPQHQLDLFSF